MAQPAVEITAEQAQVAAISSYAGIIAQIRQRVIDFLTRLWRGLPSYHRSDVDGLLQQVVPAVLAGQRQVAALTDAYLNALYTHMSGAATPSTGSGVAAVAAYDALRHGVQPDDVYERPFIAVWTALKDGKPLDEAIRLGEQRLQDLAATDLQLAKTHASRQVLAKQDRIVGYRRVLEGAYSCGLCILASTQRYHKQDLMAIHPGCDCSVAPIYGTQDPGQTINDQLVIDVHQAIADRFGKSKDSGRNLNIGGGDLRSYTDLIVTHDHGEIGPVLGVRGQDFTGPSAIH